MAAGLVGHLSSTPFPMKQHVPEGTILSVPGTCLPQGCLPLASWFLSICRCHGRPSALQEALVQEALVLLWYFHCCFFVEELMPRLLSAAHSLVRWCDPRDCCPCLSWLLSQGLPSSLHSSPVPWGRRGREGFASALMCLCSWTFTWGYSSTWKSTLLPPNSKDQAMLVAWLAPHPPAPCAKAAVFLSLGESQTAVCSMTVPG